MEYQIIKQDENNTSIYLSNNLDQVTETIHLDNELFEAKKTSITDIQEPVQLDNNLSIEEISNNKIVDYIDIPSPNIYSDDQKPEAIIVTTTEETSLDHLLISDEKSESIQIMPSK